MVPRQSWHSYKHHCVGILDTILHLLLLPAHIVGGPADDELECGNVLGYRDIRNSLLPCQREKALYSSSQIGQEGCIGASQRMFHLDGARLLTTCILAG